MFYDLNCFLLFLTAYHSQTDSLLKQTNQTTEIIIQFFTISHLNKDWDIFLLSLQAQLNSARHAVIKAVLNKLIYDVNFRSAFNTLNKPY